MWQPLNQQLLQRPALGGVVFHFADEVEVVAGGVGGVEEGVVEGVDARVGGGGAAVNSMRRTSLSRQNGPD